MAIDRKNCGVSIGSGISGTRDRKNASMLDERLESRIPLLDSTNILRNSIVSEEHVGKTSTKGHWKRRARMHGQGDIQQKASLKERNNGLNKKMRMHERQFWEG